MNWMGYSLFKAPKRKEKHYNSPLLTCLMAVLTGETPLTWLRLFLLCFFWQQSYSFVPPTSDDPWMLHVMMLSGGCEEEEVGNYTLFSNCHVTTPERHTKLDIYTHRIPKTKMQGWVFQRFWSDSLLRYPTIYFWPKDYFNVPLMSSVDKWEQ